MVTDRHRSGFGINRRKTVADKGDGDILRVAIAIVVVASVVVPVAFYHSYTFDKAYHSEMSVATQAGTPEELVTHLERARDGLNEVGYDTGQYAWFWKTPRSNTDVKRSVLNSHIDRARSIAAMDGAEQQVAFLDYRERLAGGENSPGTAPDIDTYSWWWHTLPFGIGIIFHRLLVTFLFMAGGVSWYIVLSSAIALRGDPVSFTALVVNGDDAIDAALDDS